MNFINNKNYIVNLKKRTENNEDIFVKINIVNDIIFTYIKIENTWEKVKAISIAEIFNFNNTKELYDYIIENNIESFLDLSNFNLNNAEFRNKLIISDIGDNIIPYLVFYEKNKSNIVKSYDILNIKKIIFKEREYDVDYFFRNFFGLYSCIFSKGKISIDSWMIIDYQYIYGIENNKLKLKIGDTLFYIDDLFLKFQKICFNHKRFFNDDYDKLFREVVDYLNEYNKNIKLEKIQPIINYGGNAKVTFTIDNYDRNFHFTEPPFEIEIPYNFDDFIKSHSIKKMLRNKIKKHYKAWDGNFYRFDIEYNGRKETLFL